MPRAKAKPPRQANGAGSVFRNRKSGAWRAMVTLPDGTRRSVSAPTQGEAIAKRNELLGHGATGTPVPKGTAILAGQLEHWKDYTLPAKHLAPATVEQYRWALRILDEYLGKAKLAKLTPELVERFLAARADEGLSRNSVRILRTVLSMVLAEAERRGHVVRNAARLAHLPADATPPAERRSLTSEEAARLLAEIAGDPLEAFFVLALTTGARRGELLGLSWRDVDLDVGTVTIRQALRRGPEGGYVVGPPKNSASIRTVRLGTAAIAALKRHRKGAVRHVGTEDLVFTTATGTHLDPSRLRRRWNDICARAELDDVVLHELRHTAGSQAVDAGVALTTVADQLGHADVNMLARVYRHRTRPVVEDVAAVMDAFVAPGSAKRRR